VIDVLHAQVVRGVGGRRNEYRPNQSGLVSSSDPFRVAEVFRNQFGLTTLYLADLDGILTREPHLSLYAELQRAGFTLWVDAGVRDAADVAAVFDAGVDTVIVGLESCASPEFLPQFVQRFGSDRLLFSLDLRAGEPMLSSRWPVLSPLAIAEIAFDAGFQRMLVLDLADVGTNTGGQTDALLQAIRRDAPHARLVAGGGVRNVADLKRLSDLGVDAALVASALHDGRLKRDDLW
jgi:phosphoribosylformimino-5-aminoimidazole carboxamide ribotide isomerase